MRPTTFVLRISGPLLIGSAAFANFSYDAITPPSTQWLGIGGEEMADDTMLGEETGLMITGVTFRLRSSTFLVPLTGTLRARMYTSAGDQPGMLLAEATIPVSIPERETRDMYVDLPDFLAPSRDLWTSYTFTSDQSPASYPWILVGITPTIGSSNPDGRRWSELLQRWGYVRDIDAMAVQIHAVPAPSAGTIGVLTLAVIGARRRRQAAPPNTAQCAPARAKAG